MGFSLHRERGSSKRSRARYIFWTLLWNVVFDLHHVVELYSVHVNLANLCVTHSGMMHLTLSWAASFPNCPIWIAWEWWPLRAYLVSNSCTFHSWFQQHNPIVLRHTNIRLVIGEQQGYAAKIMNERYTSQNQRARNSHHSWVGLWHIYPNRVYHVTHY
jgi:hypothetical protein